jgi:hypothetical protein
MNIEQTVTSKHEGSGKMTFNQAYLQATYGRSSSSEQAARAALKLYYRARVRARLGKVWSALTGRSRRLLSLETVRATSTVRGSHHAGTRAVTIGQIRGSEGRFEDFDVGFNPLQPQNKGRWLSVATAWLKDVPMPRVALIQVGDVYFVRDGHHRISVARALGQVYIDAEVMVWET